MQTSDIYRVCTAYVRSLHPPPQEEEAVPNTPLRHEDPAAQSIHSESLPPDRDGYLASVGFPKEADAGADACWTRASAMGVAAVEGDGGPGPPDRVTRWVRNALQQSWGSWLAGDESKAAWTACRQGGSGADVAFMDSMLCTVRMDGEQPAHHMLQGLSTADGVSHLGSTVPAEVNTHSVGVSVPLERQGTGDGASEGASPVLQWLPTEQNLTRARPRVSQHAADRLQQAVGAVVDEDNHDRGGPPSLPTWAGADMAEMPRERPYLGHGPELCSYIYGHVRSFP